VDTARNLEAMRIEHVVIPPLGLRAGAILAERIQSNVINAGDGTHEHPTQGLLTSSRCETASGFEGSAHLHLR